MIHDNEDEDNPTEIKEVDLQYCIYPDENHNSVYVKFSGFNNEDELKTFSEYIEKQLTLLLFTSKTLH